GGGRGGRVTWSIRRVVLPEHILELGGVLDHDRGRVGQARVGKRAHHRREKDNRDAKRATARASLTHVVLLSGVGDSAGGVQLAAASTRPPEDRSPISPNRYRSGTPLVPRVHKSPEQTQTSLPTADRQRVSRATSDSVSSRSHSVHPSGERGRA